MKTFRFTSFALVAAALVVLPSFTEAQQVRFAYDSVFTEAQIEREKEELERLRPSWAGEGPMDVDKLFAQIDRSGEMLILWRSRTEFAMITRFSSGGQMTELIDPAAHVEIADRRVTIYPRERYQDYWAGYGPNSLINPEVLSQLNSNGTSDLYPGFVFDIEEEDNQKRIALRTERGAEFQMELTFVGDSEFPSSITNSGPPDFPKQVANILSVDKTIPTEAQLRELWLQPDFTITDYRTEYPVTWTGAELLALPNADTLTLEELYELSQLKANNMDIDPQYLAVMLTDAENDARSSARIRFGLGAFFVMASSIGLFLLLRSRGR